MADQGKWFKLWFTAASDPHLANLSLEDFARWCLFGVYLKAHGKEGRIRIESPALGLRSMLRVPSFEALLDTLKKFPNTELDCVTGNVTNANVTVNAKWHNWQKYQGDNSGERVRAWRQRNSGRRNGGGNGDVTAKEEKRREEKRPPIPPSPPALQPHTPPPHTPTQRWPPGGPYPDAPDPSRPYVWDDPGLIGIRWEKYPHNAMHFDCPQGKWRGKCLKTERLEEFPAGRQCLHHADLKSPRQERTS